ncbi:hypothetical protein Tco_0732331 [Tanacetum coccineum]
MPFPQHYKKTGDTSVPLVGQVGLRPVEGEKKTNQSTITQLFQRRQEKDVGVANLINKPITEPIITKITTTSIPQTIIPTTTPSFKSPFITSHIKTTPQTEGEQNKDKGKKYMSREEVADEESDSDIDAKSRPSSTLKESSKTKSLNKFTYFTETGERNQLTEEDINNQKGIVELAKTEAVKFEREWYRKQDFIGIEYFGELNNDTLYHVQEIFFRLYQGLGMDDLARTFSSLMVSEVDKRNLNPNKQMRLIE